MSESAEAAVTAVHCILVITNIAGNSLVCVIIIKNREMRYVEIQKYVEFTYTPQLTMLVLQSI